MPSGKVTVFSGILTEWRELQMVRSVVDPWKTGPGTHEDTVMERGPSYLDGLE